MQHLSALQPKAVQTLAGLLSNRSGYIRLEAAKDILNRTGVGLGNEPMRMQPLNVRINLAVAAPVAAAPLTLDHEPSSDNPGIRPGGRKSGESEETRSSSHDFFPKVTAEEVSQVLTLDDEPEGIRKLEHLTLDNEIDL
jgi:hypothetical protein